MKEVKNTSSLVERLSKHIKSKLFLLVTSLVLVLFPTDLFSRGAIYSPSIQGPGGRAFGRILKSFKSLKKAGPTIYAVKKAGDLFIQQTARDSVSFSTNMGYPGFYNTSVLKANTYVGPYNQWQTTNYLDVMNLEIKVREYHSGENGSIGSYDNTGIQSQASSVSSLINPVDSLELQRKMWELRQSIENTRKSFNSKSK